MHYVRCQNIKRKQLFVIEYPLLFTAGHTEYMMFYALFYIFTPGFSN
jgi:hypothetical protein